MLSYNRLQERPRELLAATGLSAAEFEQLLAAFATAYVQQYPPERTLAGKARQRQGGAGAKSKLKSLADKLLFVLVYQKTNPLQTMHGLQFGLSQGQANYWIHHLLPVLQQEQALRELGQSWAKAGPKLGQSWAKPRSAPPLRWPAVLWRAKAARTW